MKADRSEFNPPRKKSIQPLKEAQQAAVSHEKLIQDPKWDIFLQQLQAVVEETKAQLADFKNKLDDPRIVNAEEVQSIRTHIFICNERIGTLTSVIDLPKQIIERGEQAKLELSKE